MRPTKSVVSLEIWAGMVWLAIGTFAGLMSLSIDLPPVNGAAALAEAVLCGPLAVWLGLLAAQALATGEWQGVRQTIPSLMREIYWGYMLVCITLAACFLSLFVRGFLSLSLLL